LKAYKAPAIDIGMYTHESTVPLCTCQDVLSCGSITCNDLPVCVPLDFSAYNNTLVQILDYFVNYPSIYQISCSPGYFRAVALDSDVSHPSQTETFQCKTDKWVPSFDGFEFICNVTKQVTTLMTSTTQAPLTSSTPTTTSPVISTTPAPEASPRINVSSPSSNTIVNESNTFIGLPSHLWGVVTAQSSQASFRTSQLISFETGMLQFHGVCDCSTFDSRDWILLNGSTTSDVAACSRQSCSAASSFPYSIRIPVVPPSTAASKLDSFLQADWILNLQSQHVRLSARNKLLKFFITAPSNASNIAQGLVNAVLLNQSSKVVNSASSTFLRLAVHVAESSWSSWEAGAEKFLILELRNSTRASLWWSVAPSFASSWEANPTLSLQDEQQSPHTEWQFSILSDPERLKSSTLPFSNPTDLTPDVPFLFHLHESVIWYSYLRIASGSPVVQGDGVFPSDMFPSLSQLSCRRIASLFVTDLGVGARYAYSFDRSLVQAACQSDCSNAFTQTLLTAVNKCRSSWQEMVKLGPSRWNGVAFTIFQSVLDSSFWLNLSCSDDLAHSTCLDAVESYDLLFTDALGCKAAQGAGAENALPLFDLSFSCAAGCQNRVRSFATENPCCFGYIARFQQDWWTLLMPEGQETVQVDLPYGWTRTYERPLCVGQSKIATFSCLLASCVEDTATQSSQCCPSLTCYNGGKQRSRNACQCSCPEGRHTGLDCSITSDLVYANLLLNLSQAYNSTEELRVRTGVAAVLSLSVKDVYVNLVQLIAGRRASAVAQLTYQLELRVVASNYDKVLQIFRALQLLSLSGGSSDLGSLSPLRYFVACNESTWCCADAAGCLSCAAKCCQPCALASNSSSAPPPEVLAEGIPRELSKPALAYYWIAVIIIVVVLSSYGFAYRRNASFRSALHELGKGCNSLLLWAFSCCSWGRKKRSRPRLEFIPFSPTAETTSDLGDGKIESSDTTLLPTQVRPLPSPSDLPGAKEGPPASERQPVMGYNLYYRQTSVRRERGKVVMEEVKHVVSSQIEFVPIKASRAPAQQGAGRAEQDKTPAGEEAGAGVRMQEKSSRRADEQPVDGMIRQGRGMKLWDGSFEENLRRLREDGKGKNGRGEDGRGEDGRGEKSKLVSRGYFKAVQKYEPDQNVLSKFLVQQVNQGEESAPSTSRSHYQPGELEDDQPSLPSTRVVDVRAEKFTSSQWEYDPSERHGGVVSL